MFRILREMDGVRERIYRHCTLAFESHVKELAREGIEFDRTQLIAEMATWLDPDEPDRTKVKARIRSALNNCWPSPMADGTRKPLEHNWRLDYLEAFAVATEAPVSRITHLNYEGEARVDEATYAALYSQAVGRRLSVDQVKRISRNLKREIAIPGMFELVAAIAEELIKAESKDDAAAKAHSAVMEANSEMWIRKKPPKTSKTRSKSKRK